MFSQRALDQCLDTVKYIDSRTREENATAQPTGPFHLEWQIAAVIVLWWNLIQGVMLALAPVLWDQH